MGQEMETSVHWIMSIFMLLAWSAFSWPAVTGVRSTPTFHSLSSPHPGYKPEVHAALATASLKHSQSSKPDFHTSKTLQARAAKTKGPAIAVFDNLALSVLPPNWCGFIAGEPGRFITCQSTETCALASSNVCCALSGSCSELVTACATRTTQGQSRPSTTKGTLYCDGPSSYCQTLSYGDHATVLKCAEEPGNARLVPASNFLSSCSGLKVSYRHDKEGQGYTFHGIYKQTSTSKAKHSEAPTAKPSAVYDYLSSLRGHPPSCAAEMNNTCAPIFSDLQRFWNTTDPRNYYCGDLVHSSCNGLCQDNSTSARDYMNWNTHVCENYLNTYDPLSHSQGFYQKWPELPALSNIAYLDLFPWKWLVVDESGTTNTTTPQSKCASASAELGSFAVINVIVLLVSVLLSRRTFVSRITCGRWGKEGSSMWILTGLLSFILSVAANLVNALLLRNTPGYGHVPVGGLVLLWATRPRMAWIVILLVNFQSESSEYLGSAASAALSETLQQLVGLAYVGRTANYARVHGLFTTSRLAHIPHSHDATLMYRGSVLVLVSVPFAVLSILVIMRPMRKLILDMLKRGKGDIPEQQTVIPLSDRSTNPAVARNLQAMTLEQDHVGLVHRMAIYMVPLFIGQWIFWAGFINLSGDRYCPPNIWRMMGVWSGFSSLGLLFGSAG